MSSRKFRDLKRLFLANKEMITNNEILLKGKVKEFCNTM